MIGRKTYYQVLMVDPSADQDIMGVVYRRLAQRYHPDIDPSDEARQRMTEINQAWQVLRDPEKRSKYDRELANRRDRRTSDRYIRRTPVEPPPEPGGAKVPAAGSRPAAESAYGEAGPPPRGHRPGNGARVRALQGLVHRPDRDPRPGLPGVAPAVPIGSPVPRRDRHVPRPPRPLGPPRISRRRDPAAWRCSRAVPARARC